MNIKKYLVREGVPEELHDEALTCFARAKQVAKPLLWYKLKAPFVMLWLLFFTKQIDWADDSMPSKWWRYDNNISMNGDGWGTLKANGECLNYPDESQGQVIHYGDHRYTGDSYYCKGHHPRSKWARWVWLGWRNKASAYAQVLGEELDLYSEYKRWGTLDSEVNKEGTHFNYCDGLWQMRDYRRVFFGLLCIRRNLGYKVNNAFVEKKSSAMVTWIPFSLRGWKG